MKYEYYPKRRTEQERRELNEQILRLLQSEACEQAGVTDEDIFNRYTGDGGLHGLRRSDYENYNAFSAAKKELENGQFFTPPPLCEMIVSALCLSDTDLVADLTCGMGNFFNFLPNERNAYGCEVDPNACAVARKLYPQAHIVQGDIRDYEPQAHFDFVLGNPPFHLRWVMPDATVMTSHQYYCLKAAKLLKPLGILVVIVPASFLADSFSDKGAIRMMESRFSFLGQVMLPEHAFSDSGVDDFPTKLQFWQKKSTTADWAPKRYSTDCSDIYIPSGHPVMAATALYEKFVMVAKADLAGNRNKVFLELAQLKTTKSTFLYQVKKYLYQIRSHPVTREKYDACFAYVHRFYTQRQPADMPYEEWQRVQLTEAKVLAYLKQALCRQNAKPEQDEIRLVKQKYSFVYKAYSRKMAKLLTGEMRAPVPIYQAVLNDEPERFPGYERLLRRKRREYDNQEQPFSEMTENAQLADWIGRFQYWDAQNHAYRGKYYTLTDQRIPYRRDKTEDERFFILTLFAIAHEIEAMEQYSGSLMRVQLAVGLPPAHFGVQAKRFINYFNGRGAVAFQFKGKTYAIFIENTACFPQSFSAAAATVKNLASFPRALVVDIGGFTADYVRLRNGVPDMAACDSLENGVILLYNRICAKANAELDILLEESEIDRILRSEDQDAAPEVIALAEREAQEFINDLLSGLRERMLELKSGKVIFLGGGATLLRRQIEASGKTGQAIFVEDINANAKGYEYLYRLQHSGR